MYVNGAARRKRGFNKRTRENTRLSQLTMVYLMIHNFYNFGKIFRGYS